jgi:hypothetical protein
MLSSILQIGEFMLKIIRTESRYFTETVKKLRELLSFIPDLDDYELVDNTGGIPKVVGYSVPNDKYAPVTLRTRLDTLVLQSKLNFRMSHSGKFSMLQYSGSNFIVSINFVGGHSNISIKDANV